MIKLTLSAYTILKLEEFSDHKDIIFFHLKTYFHQKILFTRHFYNSDELKEMKTLRLHLLGSKHVISLYIVYFEIL